MTVTECIFDMMETRTILRTIFKLLKEQLRLKLFQNLRSTNLGQNVLVFKKHVIPLNPGVHCFGGGVH